MWNLEGINNMTFSVLMSIYQKEKPEYFNRAMQSIWDEQTVKPDEIILVQDGPLTDELYKSIDKWKIKIGNIFKMIPLEKNVGLGDALNIGIRHCTYELIARMDTDDISLPNRFENQLKIFENSNIDICSSWLSEFEDDELKIKSYKKLPENHDDIVRYAKVRCPINHPTVMYKKSAVEIAGGYQKMMLLEDYYLWGRMIVKGARFYNIQVVLLNMRAGDSMIQRRAGIVYAKSELRLLNEFKKIGFLTISEYIKNLFIRVPIRLMPIGILKFAYGLLRSKKG